MDLVLALVGIIFLVKGDIKTGKNRAFSKKGGRILGALFLLPVLFFGLVPGFTYDGVVVYGVVVLGIIFLKKRFEISVSNQILENK